MKQFEYYQMERPELARLVPEGAIRILDVGCGAGGLGRTLLRENPSREMHGIEIIESAAIEAKKHYREVHVGELESINLPYEEGFFDVIFFADVLEHLLDPWSALASLRKYLNDEGVAISSIPNIGHWSILNGLFQGEWNYCEAGILDKTHLRFFTLKSITAMYRNAGFRVQSTGGTSVGVNQFETPAFQAGLQSIGTNAPQFLAESNVFQFLTVAKKAVFSDKTSIIVSLDGGMTLDMLRALKTHTPKELAEIILVGNPDDFDLPDSELEGITLLPAETTMSFSQKINLAAEKANGQQLCFLHSNIMVTPNWLERLLECLLSSDAIEMVAPISAGVEGEQNLENISVKSEHDLVNFSEKVFNKLVGNWFETSRLDSFCLLLRTGRYQEVGGFNNALRNERTAVASLCNKLQESGGKLVIAQDTFVYHLPFNE